MPGYTVLPLCHERKKCIIYSIIIKSSEKYTEWITLNNVVSEYTIHVARGIECCDQS